MSSERSEASAPEASTRAEPIIRVRGVGKRYRIWASPGARLRAFAAESAAALLPHMVPARARLLRRAAACYRDFEALAGIDFDVTRGEAVGIIGRNGSGKSTLLQIIAGTLQPSAGEVEVRGRVAALLELGSAFHPQFTGRENVYLYCTILGVPRARVDALFDDIAAFADIGEFMDQPVKTYSSGMMLRLAFSVQTAITPEVLIVDEALAVGDAFFQARCMRRIQDMLDQGTTLLFVSHAMSTVREVCTRGILLDHGRMVFDGEVSRATQRYLALHAASEPPREVHQAAAPTVEQRASKGTAGAPAVFRMPPSLGGHCPPEAPDGPEPDAGRSVFEQKAAAERILGGRARFWNVQMLDSDQRLTDALRFGEPVTLRMYIDVEEPVPYLLVAYNIRSVAGTSIVHCNTNLVDALEYRFEAGRRYRLDWRFNASLQHGQYYLGCGIALPDPPRGTASTWTYLDMVNHALDFRVAPRSQGLIGGFVALRNELVIEDIGAVAAAPRFAEGSG